MPKQSLSKYIYQVVLLSRHLPGRLGEGVVIAVYSFQTCHSWQMLTIDTTASGNQKLSVYK